MNRPHGIVVFGGNGSGKTTLGRELARILGYKHIDHEHYAFAESEIPYAIPRPHAECIALMLADIEKYRQFVLSAVTGDLGEAIPQFYVLGVHISTPLALRVERFEQREYQRHGERILRGGDMHASHMRFRGFIASRSLAGVEQWKKSLVFPVISIDGTLDWRTNARRVAEQFCAKSV